MKKLSKYFLRISLKLISKPAFWGSFFFFLFLLSFLSFFHKAGILGEKFFSLSSKILGRGAYFLPLVFFLSSLSFFFSVYAKKELYITLSLLLFVLSSASFFGQKGGFLGENFYLIFAKLFGEILAKIIFFFLFFFSLFIFYSLLKPKREKISQPSFIKRILIPIFREKEILPPKRIIEVKEVKEEKEEKIRKEKPIFPVYQNPPLELLETEKGRPSPGDIKENSLIIKKTLEDFGIEVEMGGVNIGPTVTQYTLRPADGIKLSKITSLSDNLSLALASHPIRIEAPIPGKPFVGIEVPNKVRTIVRLRNLISQKEFKSAPSPLTFVVGRDVSGKAVFADLARMPHLLVAGATGTGKTVFLNSLILSLVYRNSPKILKFILIDPKRVEFPAYQNLPHLIAPVIFNSGKVVRALDWLVSEMERRFTLLAKATVRDISGFNKKALFEGESLMPYIVLIIDELADIMAAKGREVENRIVRLAQLARAVGIHLVLATQRPSVEVLTGLIKANITARIAFQVASQFDSRTILDLAGAEKLLGKGDMLFLSPESPKPKRVQGAFISEKEVQRVVNWFKEKEMLPKFAKDLVESLQKEEEFEKEFFVEDDPLYEKAKEVVIKERRASASLLQRRLKIGYARAARLIDLLEKRGVVGPSRGSKPREVLIKEDEDWEKV